MTILIINHDDSCLSEVKSAFETQGYRVISTTSSVMAERLFFQHRPSVVILNACLPVAQYTNYLRRPTWERRQAPRKIAI